MALKKLIYDSISRCGGLDLETYPALLVVLKGST